MALVKCPRCELNYMQVTDTYCSVCRKEVQGEEERVEVELCNECGENPVVPGEELCRACLLEMRRQSVNATEKSVPVGKVLDLTAASAMDEIEIEIDEEIPSDEYGEINRELSTGEADGDEDAADSTDEEGEFESLEVLSDLEHEDDEEDE